VRDEAEHKADSEAVEVGARRCRDAKGVKPKPPVSVARWTLWWFLLGIGILVFYVLLTPIWIGLRALAWAAEFKARRRR
jgi:hypothetical protein